MSTQAQASLHPRSWRREDWLWLPGRQRSLCGAVLTELAGVRCRGKLFTGRFLTGCILPQITTERCQASHWRLCGVDHGAQQIQLLKKASTLGNWVLEKPYVLTAACRKQAPEPGRTDIASCKISAVPSTDETELDQPAKEKIYKGSFIYYIYITAGNEVDVECGIINLSLATSWFLKPSDLIGAFYPHFLFHITFYIILAFYHSSLPLERNDVIARKIAQAYVKLWTSLNE